MGPVKKLRQQSNSETMRAAKEAFGKPTNSETGDKQGDSQQRDLVGHMKSLGHTGEIGRDDTAGEGDDEAGVGDDHGAVPPIPLGPVLWVLWVADRERHQLVVLQLSRRAGDGLRQDDALCRLVQVLVYVGIFGDFPVGETERVCGCEVGQK